MASHYLLLLLLVAVATTVEAYPSGAPTGACVAMFPTGHHSDAQTSSPPFAIYVSANSYAVNDVISVTVNVTDPAMYYEGVFVQARRAGDCDTTTPVGTFRLAPSETVLKTLDCSGTRDAVTHKIKQHSTTRTFNWTAPAQAVGHIYFRATVVKSEHTFWTDVASPVVRDVTATAPSSTWSPCPVQKMQSQYP